MSEKKIAQVILCRCSQNKKLFGITIEKRTDGDWNMVYSYPIDEKRAKAEGFENTSITADIYTDSRYLGCPYCQKRGFVKCGTCQKPTCHTNGNSENTCAWCGKKLSDIKYRGKMTVKTGAD